MTLQIETLGIDRAAIAWAWVGAPTPSPLVFLHGLGDSAIMTFERIARHPALAGRSSLLIDLPGFGFGHAPDDWSGTMEDHARAVAALMDHLGTRGSTIVGHSMGGSLALLVADGRPDLVARLVLAEPLLVRAQSELGKAIARRPEPAFVDRGYAMLELATRRRAARGDDSARGFLQPLRRANPTVLHRSATSLLATSSPSYLKILEKLPIPRTLLIGARTTADLAFVPEDVRVRRIADAGHSMMSEQPEAFALAIAESVGDGL